MFWFQWQGQVVCRLQHVGVMCDLCSNNSCLPSCSFHNVTFLATDWWICWCSWIFQKNADLYLYLYFSTGYINETGIFIFGFLWKLTTATVTLWLEIDDVMICGGGRIKYTTFSSRHHSYVIFCICRVYHYMIELEQTLIYSDENNV